MLFCCCLFGRDVVDNFMKYIVCFVGLQAPVSALFCNNGVVIGNDV